MKRHPLLIGLVLIFACTWSIDLTLAAQARGWVPAVIPAGLGMLVGFGFLIAAVVATVIVEGRWGIRELFRRYLVWRVGWRWYAVALLGPAVVTLAAVGLAVAFGAPAPDFARPFVRRIVPQPSLWVVPLFWMAFEVLTNFEEVAWRGYVLPRLLARHSALGASLVLGIVWALWHLPKFWGGGVAEAAHAFPFWVFAIDIVAIAILYTWIFNHTRGSLLLATLFHAAGNTAYVCLPIGTGVEHGTLPFYISIALHCLWAIAVVVATGLGLVRRRAAEAPSRAEAYSTTA